MAAKQDQAGRCGWVALGLVFVLLHAILPVSFFAGLTGLKKILAFFGETGLSDLIRRVVVISGMITGLLLSAIVVMALTTTINRWFSFLFRQTAPSSANNSTARLLQTDLHSLDH